MKLLTGGPKYFLGKGLRVGIDNRFTSVFGMIQLHKMKTNAFGTVRVGRKYLPEDLKDMLEEAKDYEPGEYQTRYSSKAGLTFGVIKSNSNVKVLSNCHSTTEEIWLDRFVPSDSEEEIDEIFKEERVRGRKNIKTSLVLSDYSLTMNKTDCGDGGRSRIVKYNRHSSRMSQPFLDLFSYEIAAVNAHVMWRGKNPESRMGIRVFCEKVIEETLQPFIDGDINCWLRRARKRPRNLEKVFYKRFSGKPVKNCTPLELRNELGPAAADPNFDLGKYTRSEKSRLRASQCMDFMVRKSLIPDGENVLCAES